MVVLVLLVVLLCLVGLAGWSVVVSGLSVRQARRSNRLIRPPALMVSLLSLVGVRNPAPPVCSSYILLQERFTAACKTVGDMHRPTVLLLPVEMVITRQPPTYCR